MNTTLDVTCGIYNTEYSLTKHRNGTRTVCEPYIKWMDNTGCLAHRKIKISAEHGDFIDDCFVQGDAAAAFDLRQHINYIDNLARKDY